MNLNNFSSSNWKLFLDDEKILWVTLECPGRSANILSYAVREELNVLIDNLCSKDTSNENTKEIKGIVFKSDKNSGFAAGADITEFSEMFKLPKDAFLSRVKKVTKSLVSLENLPFPTVVAINGYALGGGLEVCMACDYRVLSDRASIGLPEATLGIIPGFGGTVRLPRITDISTALEWMTSGAIQNAKHALEKGAVDEVVPESDLRDVALEKLSDFASDIRDYKTLRFLKSQPIDCDHSMLDQTCNSYRDSADKKPGRNYPAPLTLVEMLRSSAKLKRESAQELESEAGLGLATAGG